MGKRGSASVTEHAVTLEKSALIASAPIIQKIAENSPFAHLLLVTCYLLLQFFSSKGIPCAPSEMKMNLTTLFGTFYILHSLFSWDVQERSQLLRELNSNRHFVHFATHIYIVVKTLILKQNAHFIKLNLVRFYTPFYVYINLNHHRYIMRFLINITLYIQSFPNPNPIPILFLFLFLRRMNLAFRN